MLKRRIIPIELLDSGRLTKTVRFTDRRDVGDPVKSSKVYSDQDADELVLLNIDRTQRNVESLLPVVESISQECFVPFLVGGGIKSYADAAALFKVGADKVLINSSAYCHLDLIDEIANSFGKQAIVIGIDVRRVEGQIVLYSDCGRQREDKQLIDHLQDCMRFGAGEFLIQSIDNDGTMDGYDLDLLTTVISVSTVPVIVAGGAGDFVDLRDALQKGADGAACGSLFNFGDNNPLRAKAYLKNYDIPLKVV